MTQKSRVAELLSGVTLDLTGVDLMKARSKGGGGRFLSTAVKEALEGTPKMKDKLEDRDYDAISAWLSAQLQGQAVSTSALTTACAAAVSALSSPTRPSSRKVVSVDKASVTAAMADMLRVRNARILARQNARAAADAAASAEKTPPTKTTPASKPRVAKKKGK